MEKNSKSGDPASDKQPKLLRRRVLYPTTRRGPACNPEAGSNAGINTGGEHPEGSMNAVEAEEFVESLRKRGLIR